MKTHYLYCVLSIFLFFSQNCTADTEKNRDSTTEQEKNSVVQKTGRLSVSGTYLVNEKGEKVLLKGVSFGWHNWWPRFYNASADKDETCSMLHKTASSNGGWIENDVKEWGRIVKNNLQTP